MLDEDDIGWKDRLETALQMFDRVLVLRAAEKMVFIVTRYCFGRGRPNVTSLSASVVHAHVTIVR